MYLSDIKRDDRFEGYLIVRSAEQRASANGKNYLDMTLADKSGSINAKMWDGTVQPPLAGSIVKVRATGNEFNGRMQLRVEKIRAAESRDQVDMSALIPCAPRDPNEMLGEVVRAADHIADPDLRRITCELLDRAGDKLLTFPAAKQMHHAERSGLLHHTTTMLRAANAIMSVYSQLNASLLIAGVIVHDLAKIDEMDADTLGLVSGTDVEANYVQIPMTTQFEDGKFTVEDYTALVGAMFDGTLTVSNDTSKAASDFATVITVNDQGSIK